MDILGGILSEMKTARSQRALTPQEKEKKRKQLEDARIMREKLASMKQDVTKKLEKFNTDPSATQLVLDPMNKTERHTIFEVIDAMQLPAHSFGRKEDECLFIIVYKPETDPSQGELRILKSRYRDGYVEDPIEEKQEESQPTAISTSETSHQTKPASRKRKKADESAPPAPIDLIPLNVIRRDLRTIEEVQLELKAQKMQKVAKISDVRDEIEAKMGGNVEGQDGKKIV
eukprot:TRINITY_DN9260_c0_g1_i1.p2 TRINITY_DN9260_c0_g1~~TRINITY_DN9260_c0_g1_i1.p2  ORF type:complete len:237 (-),score=80.89 TRINITY_DN9260_c0_g1_i1:16-705(-)